MTNRPHRLPLRKSLPKAFIPGVLTIVLALSAYNSWSVQARMEKDGTGRNWELGSWQDGSRPYPFNLTQREELYNKRYGERWDGPLFGNRILTPGDWKWEAIATIPEPLASQLWVTKNDPNPHHQKRWGGSWPMPSLFAPGGERANDLYISATHGFVHLDLKTGQITFIGSSTEGGSKDGVSEKARIDASLSSVDVVTGRVYWVQGKSLRYVEKLLRYQEVKSGSEVLLPAILDYRELYRKVTAPSGGALEPVVRGGKRAAPVFVVRTCSQIRQAVYIPGSIRGARPLLTPDGKRIYIADGPTWKEESKYDETSLVEIGTGKALSRLKLAGEFPLNMLRPPLGDADGAGSHGANNAGIDGLIYTSQHTGSGGGPARLLAIEPESGKIITLYDSVQEGSGLKRKSPVWDGPADAKSLTAASTDYQIQCPRTGAIINGGWDNSGIRRYLGGFVTSIVNGDDHFAEGRPGWGSWGKGKGPFFAYHNCEPAVAPNGDLYLADPQSIPQRIIRIYRTDWPKEQPVYGYGERFMPRAKLEELVLEYAREYVAKYDEWSKID